MAVGKGMRIAPTPTIASSESVLAPARATTRSAHCNARGDVVDERVDARFDAGGRVGRARLVDTEPASLVPDLGPPLRRQLGQRQRQRSIQSARALAAADDEQPATRAAARAEPLARGIARRDRVADGIPDDLDARGGREGVRKRREDPRGERREQPVRRPGHGVLLVQHDRPAREPRRDGARCGDEPSHPEHGGRITAAQRGERLRDSRDHAERRAQVSGKPAAADTRDRDPLDLDAVRGHDTRFDSALRAEPYDGEVVRA